MYVVAPSFAPNTRSGPLKQGGNEKSHLILCSLGAQGEQPGPPAFWPPGIRGSDGASGPLWEGVLDGTPYCFLGLGDGETER